jgi:hypothetical protein
MIGMSRVGVLLLASAAAGALLWTAAQFSRSSTGGYWAAYGIVAAAGLVFGLAQIRGRTGHPPGQLLAVFLPVLIVGGWVLLAMQPSGSHGRGQILSWSGHLGIADVVRDLGTWIGVIAFGIGYTLGAAIEPAPVRRTLPPAYDEAAADEPTTAERREVAAEEEAGRAQEPVR